MGKPELNVRSIDVEGSALLWVQTENYIRSQIADGALRYGARLPPERDLCVRLGISRVTLRKALLHLQDTGVLTDGPGRGWYVAEPAQSREHSTHLESFAESAARRGLVPSSKVLAATIDHASFAEADELAVAPGSELFHLTRVRLLNGLPVATDDSRVPLEYAPGLPEIDFEVESLFSALGDAGVRPEKADSTIEAQRSDEMTARHLQLEPGDPILLIHERTLDRAGRAVLLSNVRYRGDRYRLSTTFSRSDQAE